MLRCRVNASASSAFLALLPTFIAVTALRVFVIRTAEDRFAEMNAHALPLGILPCFRPDPPAHLQLHSGDLVVLATDGFFEWENDQGEQFGVPRMEGVVRASRDLAASEIIGRLYSAVTNFSNGTKQQDDLTAVIIKRL
jgi:serine phosphatase RsbU (regulator of sigma subunit)